MELPKESIKLRKSLKKPLRILPSSPHPKLCNFRNSHQKFSASLSLSLCPQRIGPNLPGYVRFHLQIKLAHALFQISISINLNNSHCSLKVACINLHHTNTCLEAPQSGASHRIQIQLRNLTSKILSPPSPHLLRFCNFQCSFRPVNSMLTPTRERVAATKVSQHIPAVVRTHDQSFTSTLLVRDSAKRKETFGLPAAALGGAAGQSSCCGGQERSGGCCAGGHGRHRHRQLWRCNKTAQPYQL